MTTPLPEEASALVNECIGEEWTARPLRGDMSVRAYYRIASPDRRSYILAYYPPELRSQLWRFLAAYEAVHPHARPPEVVGSSSAAVLQRDVGDATLFDLLHDDREEGVRRYREAIDLIVAFQQSSGGREINPPFDAQFFTGELEMAREFYVDKLMGAAPSPRLSELLGIVAENVASHPYVLCHRDYHGENLHLIKDKLFMLDYQDMRMGPDMYDLVSLLRDRGVARIIGDATELELLDYYAESAKLTGDYRRRYFEALLQRTIKILGSFAKLPVVRLRLHYLDFIPPTLESLQRCIAELPEYGELATLIPMAFSIDAARTRARRLNKGVPNG
ncbi:MAG TPA: phosphotransferase [Thermoanaerobaculia bacterium]